MTSLRQALADALRSFPRKDRKWLSAAFLPRPSLNVWQWAGANVDFSRAMNYDTPVHGPFDPDYMPYWKEPCECLTDTDINEITILKATRTGGSENVLLNSIRYAIAMRPQPVLYVTSDQLSAERFMDRRIKRSMRCADSTAREYRHAQATQHDIAFPSMDLRVTWPKAKQAFKQDGWAMMLCDELSTWPDYTPDMARRRTDSYPFPHIVFLSSPDPAQRRASDDDPIFVEYRRGDQRKWNMPDPAGGEFFFEMGKRGAAGLQWDDSAKRDDGTWDYEKVEASAWYQTPNGARIENKDRRAVVASGHWVATNPNAPKSCRSYHVTIFMTPFAAGDFGRIASAFLKAKAGGTTALRTFIYEYLAEPWTMNIESTNDDALFKRCMNYALGESCRGVFNIAKTLTTFATADVQKDHLWGAAREWVDGGDSGLVGYSYLATFEHLEEFANKHKAVRVGVDCGYETRALEVYEYAIKYKALPLRGSDSLSFMAVKELKIDPYEGRRGHGEVTVLTYLFNADIFKSLLLDMMRGEAKHQWILPQNVPQEYILQAGSEEKRDGVWTTKRGRSQNHLADCETMQLVMAFLHRIYRNEFLGRPT